METCQGPLNTTNGNLKRKLGVSEIEEGRFQNMLFRAEKKSN